MVVLIAQWLWKFQEIWRDTFWHILEKNLSVVNIVNIQPIEKPILIFIWSPNIESYFWKLNEKLIEIETVFLPNLIQTFPWLQNAPIRLGPKQFGCQLCSMIFKTHYNARRHIMIHTGEKPFHCQYCNYSANQNAVVRNHMKTNHKQTKQI